MPVDQDERETFEDFGETEAADGLPPRTHKAFSWIGFLGGLAAVCWSGSAVGAALSYFGAAALMAMDPLMRAGLAALTFGPALLFWISASAAGEALKARRLAEQLTQLAHAMRPIDLDERRARRLSNNITVEIDTLNDTVAAALDRLSELETATQRNAALFGDAVAASRDNAEVAADTLARERDKLAQLNDALRDQAEAIADSIGTQNSADAGRCQTDECGSRHG